ncbi:hypothetical protein HPB51_023480 [Rhipicephalus microplus]|uniref:Uncharacterized protein n=1 Tax=Rhipicephalus microplus TaxID=6941 RepID=A0A9J6F7V9_RHIMP|nr:hypothetical protein HPB51_023480 [Rhipicephalus microplus]
MEQELLRRLFRFCSAGDLAGANVFHPSWQHHLPEPWWPAGRCHRWLHSN